MDNYNNACPITQSIFSHCNPLKKIPNEFEKEPGEETPEVFEPVQGYGDEDSQHPAH